jgi:hypothetical protein
MPSNTIDHVRVDERVKRRCVGNAGESFEVSIPTATTVKAMRSAEKKQGKRFRSPKALFEDLGI